MGYLNKATITVDAILTNRGRELLAEAGPRSFVVSKYALADDEIDYRLWNENHPNGDKGAIIENMPILEATPDEQQIMRYKLVSLPSAFILASGEIVQPQIINFGDSTNTITIPAGSDASSALQPRTNQNFSEGTNGYTLVVANANLFEIRQDTVTGTLLNTPGDDGTINANGSVTIKFNTATPTFVFKRISGVTGDTTATIFGGTSGATKTVTITVR